MTLPIGTLLNVLTVVLGTVLGGVLGNRLAPRMRETAVAATGLITLVLGVQMGLQTRNILITLGSLVVGGVLGEWWRLDARLEALGRWVERKVTRPDAPPGRSVAQAFVTASLIFCVGPVTVIGALNDGRGDVQLLAIKALLDGITAIALASSLGWGVGLSAITVLLIQGTLATISGLVGQRVGTEIATLTIIAGSQEVLLSVVLLGELTAVGGIVIVALGMLLLEIKTIRIANFLPALVLAPVVVLVLYWLGAPVAP